MKLALVAGARPNFMKVAPIVRALQARGHAAWTLVHTGQHYDQKMSDVFFRELGMPEPHHWLGVGSGSHAVQTAKVITAFEEVCLQERPDRVVVVGDVNSTLAATLVAAKLNVPVAHVEAGLRSGDRTMPEEINRIVTDVLSDVLLTPSADADENLLKEGMDRSRIHFVGNVMVDSLLAHVGAADERSTLRDLGLTTGSGGTTPYALVTLHRPSNVDVPRTFEEIMRAIERVSRSLPVIFPAHPRAAARAAFLASGKSVRVVEPLGYLDFLAVMKNAKLVLTDSGGVQEETTVLGVPCVTLRGTTERPITVTMGTNRVAGTRFERIVAVAESSLADPPRGRIPPFWDGRAAGRIVDVLLSRAET